MSRIQMPTREEVLQLAEVRADVCVSVYLETSPMKMYSEGCRIELGNLLKDAYRKLEEEGFDKRRLEALRDEVDTVTGEEDFCRYQANSLVILATPDMVRVYRLANHLTTQLEVSDRFHLQPLLRALTFPHTAYILALSDNETRVIELCPDSEPERMRLPDLPRDAMSALGLKHMTASVSALNESGSKERKRRLAVYCRKVDEALKPLVKQCDSPVILAAAEPIASIFRSVATVCLADETVTGSPDRLSDHELVELARPVLDKHYVRLLEGVKERFEERAGQNRVATDIADVARAATYGMVSLALVDFEQVTPGLIDENGEVVHTDEPGAYGVIDEIVKRSLESGAKVLSVRAADMIGDTGVAAVLRYPLEPAPRGRRMQ